MYFMQPLRLLTKSTIEHYFVRVGLNVNPSFVSKPFQLKKKVVPFLSLFNYQVSNDSFQKLNLVATSLAICQRLAESLVSRTLSKRESVTQTTWNV